MNINVINECKALSLLGKITFPEVVTKLAAVGVERYIVDIVAAKVYYYGVEGETYTTDYGISPQRIMDDFNGESIKAAITEIQNQRIDYRNFLQHIISAGCSHYEVFITGKKVIYLGRDGSQHIENFPAAS